MKVEIYKAIKESGVALSVRAIAKNIGIDTTSENLNDIRTDCHEMSNDDILITYDRREDNMGLFFGSNINA